MLFYLISLLYASNALPVGSVNKVLDVNIMLDTNASASCGSVTNINGPALPNMPIRVLSACDCSEECRARDDCKAWTFSSGKFVTNDGRNCWLRSIFGPGVENCDGNCRSGASGSCGSVTNNNGPALQKMPIKVSSACDCSDECRTRDDCKAWTFSSSKFVTDDGRNCWLRSIFGTGVENCDGNCRSGASASCGSVTNNNGPALPNMPIKVSNACHCSKECRTRHNCKAWTFSSSKFVTNDGRNCWLRSIFGTDVENCDGNCRSGASHYKCGSVTNNNGRALPNMPIKVLSACDCSEECRTRDDCKAWTFSSSTFVTDDGRNCWLRSIFGTGVENCDGTCRSGV